MKPALTGTLAAAVALTSAVALADQPAANAQNAQTGAGANAPTTSTTTTTAATPQPMTTTSSPTDSPFAPPPAVEPEQRDSVTLYQRYRPNRAYLYTGGALFLGSYATTAAFNAVEEIDRTLFIPVVGPWLHIADRADDASTTGTVLIVGSGVLQGAGAILTAVSFFVPERVPAATIQAGNVKMNVTPTAYGRGSAGLAAVGTF